MLVYSCFLTHRMKTASLFGLKAPSRNHRIHFTALCLVHWTHETRHHRSKSYRNTGKTQHPLFVCCASGPTTSRRFDPGFYYFFQNKCTGSARVSLCLSHSLRAQLVLPHPGACLLCLFMSTFVSIISFLNFRQFDFQLSCGQDERSIMVERRPRSCRCLNRCFFP